VVGEREWSQGLPIAVRVVPGDGGACTVTVAVTGEVDLATAAVLGAALEQAEATRSGRVDVDLAGVSFLGLAGVHTLGDARRRLEAAGRELRLVRVPRSAARVLDLSGWGR
jgi:anti-sigma B factor antagonist